MEKWPLVDWEEAYCRVCGDRFLRRREVQLAERRQTCSEECRTGTCKPRLGFLEGRDRPVVFDTKNG